MNVVNFVSEKSCAVQVEARDALLKAFEAAATGGFGLLAICADYLPEPEDSEKPARQVVHSQQRHRPEEYCRNLAAFVGHEPSRMLLGEAAPLVADDPAKIVDGLSRWGNEPVLRAGIAIAEVLLPVWTREWQESAPTWRPALALFGGRNGMTGQEVAEAIESAIKCVLSPSDESRRAANEAMERVQRVSQAIVTASSARGPHQGISGIFAATWTAAWVAKLASYFYPEGESLGLRDPSPTYASHVVGWEAVRVAIREALVPWALVGRDPLRRRVG